MSHKHQNNKIGMWAFFLTIFSLGLLIFKPAYAVDEAGLLPPAVQQFFDNAGNPLASGKVYFYEVGTLTFKDVYTSSAATTPYTNPITLNAGGKPPGSSGIYGIGLYRQLVKDRNGNTIWDAVTSPTGAGGSTPTDVGDGNLVGTVLPWSGLVAPNQYVFAYGQEISRTAFSVFYTAVTQQANVICSAASNTLTGISDTSQINIGSPVELALCVAAGTTVVSKTASTVTLSNPSSVSINSVATFFPYGNGDGSATFNVPDLRGYVMAGRNNMGGSASSRLTTTYFGTNDPNALGATGGSQSTVISTANLPPYTPSGTISINSTGYGGISNTGSFTAGATTAPNTPAALSSLITATLSANAQGGTSTPITTVQPTLTLNYVIKITPDTSTSIATGVYSIGGMAGIISCGTGILCTGNIISATGITPNGAATTIQYNDTGVFNGSLNYTFISPDTVTLGAVGTTGKFDIYGSTSGKVRQVASAVAGTPTVTWGDTSGTPATTATSPLVLNSSTGNLRISPDALTRVNDTNVTLTLGSGANTSVISPTSLTLGWTGTLAGSRGGTGVNNGSNTITVAGNFNVTTNGGSIAYLAASKTLSVSNSVGLIGTDGASYTFPSTSSTIPKVVASGAKTLSTTAISSAACSSAQTDTATGTLTTDAITANFNGDPTAITGYVPLTSGMLSIIVYPTADTVNFKVCNNTVATITPGAVTLNWRVIR